MRKNMNNKISKEWVDEIIRETDHYYQGEMQQEMRASWLLSTSSALIAIIFGFFLAVVNKEIQFSNIIFITTLIVLGCSIFFSILCIMPLRVSSLIAMVKNLFRKKQSNNNKLVELRFNPNMICNEANYYSWLFSHYSKHFYRNSYKRTLVVLSLFFLCIGIFLFITFMLHVFIMNQTISKFIS